MTASEILAIKHPEWLFTQNLDAIKQKHRDLAKEWHPDVNKSKGAEHVFQHISHLYEQALKKIEEGCWGFSGILLLNEKGKKSGWILKYHVKHSFELGNFYVGDHSVVYVVEPEHESFFYNGQYAINNLKYPSKKVEEECKRYLPGQIETMETSDGKLAMAVRNKTPDMLLLRDVLKHYGTLHPTQAAWILSTLFNLGCYLWVSDLVHCDISLDTYFISPEKHSGALLGGWWYASPRGHTLTQIPKRTFDFLPWKVRNKKKASRLIDQELIRLVGRELLVGASSIPEPMKDWLNSVASGNAVSDYSTWSKEILIQSFGKRRFVKMDLTAEQLYK